VQHRPTIWKEPQHDYKFIELDNADIGLMKMGKLTVLRYPFDTGNLASPYSRLEKPSEQG